MAINCEANLITDMSITANDKDFSIVNFNYDDEIMITTEHKQSLLGNKSVPYVDYSKNDSGNVAKLRLKMKHYKAVEFVESLGYECVFSNTEKYILEFDDGTEQIVRILTYEIYKRDEQVNYNGLIIQPNNKGN